MGTTIVQAIEEWFGETLTSKLAQRARGLSVAEALAFADYLDQSAEHCHFPPRLLGEPRPLATEAVELKGLLLLADHVAVPNFAMPRRDRDDYTATTEVIVRDIVHGLEQLASLRPLAAAHAILILPYSLEVYEDRAVDRIRADPALYVIACKLFPEGEREEATEYLKSERRPMDPPWSERDQESAWLTLIKDLWIAWPLRLFISALVALEIEADSRTDVQLSRNAARELLTITMLSEGVAAYYRTRGQHRDKRLIQLLEEWRARHETDPAPDPIELLRILLTLSVPKMDNVSYRDLTHLHTSSPELAAYRAVLRRGLAVAADSNEWPASARSILEDEMRAARSGLEATIRKSKVLAQAVAGTRQAAVAVAAGAAGWLAGGTVGSTVATSTATLGTATFLNLLAASRKARKARGYLAPYLIFDVEDDVGAPGNDHFWFPDNTFD